MKVFGVPAWKEVSKTNSTLSGLCAKIDCFGLIVNGYTRVNMIDLGIVVIAQDFITHNSGGISEVDFKTGTKITGTLKFTIILVSKKLSIKIKSKSTFVSIRMAKIIAQSNGNMIKAKNRIFSLNAQNSTIMIKVKYSWSKIAQINSMTNNPGTRKLQTVTFGQSLLRDLDGMISKTKSIQSFISSMKNTIQDVN